VIDDRSGNRPPPSSRPARRVGGRLLVALGLAAAFVLEPGLASASGAAVPLAAPSGWSPGSVVVDQHQRVGPELDPVAAPASVPAVPEGPSIIALEAAAHANDRIAFAPGGAVTVPFAPRPDDRWAVGGRPPKRLPAGAASGRQIATSRQGAVWAPGSRAPQAASAAGDPRPARPIDGPALAPDAIIPADPSGALVTPADPLDPPTGTGLRRQVFGFLPYWELSDGSTTLNYDVLSTIAYFGVGANANGDLIKVNADGSTSVGWSGWTSSKLTSIIDAAHQKGTRVVLTVQAFAWTTGQANNQAALLDSDAARLNLAQQIAAAVRDRGADGVNLDFEPLVSGRADAFTAFVRTLRAQLDAITPGYQLTFDTTGSIGNYPIEDATASGGADAIVIMGYDYRTASSSTAGSVAPLDGPAYDLTDTAIAYLARVPASKLIMGVPYYGRAWSTVSDAPNAKTQTGTQYGPSASVTYASAVDLAAQYGRRYDTLEQSAWFAYQRQNCSTTYGCVTTWREVYYDDAQSLRAKYDMINRYGLRGAGIWALGYDGTRPELYQALADKFLNDTTGPAAGIKVLAPRQDDEGFAVSWAATDMSPIRDSDVQVSVDGGPWTAWLSGTSGTSAIYPGTDGHAYAFRARATDVKGNAGTWDVVSLPSVTASLGQGGFAVVVTDTLSVRTRPTTSGALAYRLSAGDIVALTNGPVSADGYTWYEISGPLQTWAPTIPVRSGNWAAAGSPSATYLAARSAPNATLVDAGISGLSFGAASATATGATAPSTAAGPALSPNGDGSGDELAIRWRNKLGLDSLTLHVFRADGSEAGTQSVPGLAPGDQSWNWDGRIGAGVLPDGRYMLQLVGKAGNRTYSAPFAGPLPPDRLAAFGVTIDTVAPTLVTVATPASLFSPNGDGRSDAIALAATSTGGATNWRFTAARLGPAGPGDPVRTMSGPDGAPTLTWDGKMDDGTVAANGTYRLTLAVLDDAGNAAATAWDVALDVTSPDLVARATPAAFSPDGDGVADTTVLDWTTVEASKVVVRIYRGTTLVRSFAQTTTTTGAIRWDGKDRSGRRVTDGTYQVRVELTDAAGNRAVSVVAVKVDRTVGSLRWGPTAFYPQDGDSLARISRVTFKLTRTASTTLQIVDATGAVVRTAWANRRLAAATAGWTWDGRNAAKAFVAPGTYTAVLTATSAVGTTTLRRSVLVDAFSVRLSATTLTAGQTLTVTFTTIEPLKSRPVVTFAQLGQAPVAMTATLVSTGRYTVSFTVAAGGVGVATLRIVAKDSSGRANVSLKTVTIE
jgi:spore germination protein YaaH/flagellar hook assembly protein FlgD